MYGYGEFEGLTDRGALELNYESWEFYEVGVWQDETGGYYLATDSGCSCPIPFENTTREDLTGPLTYEQAAEEITSLWDTASGPYFGSRPENRLPEFLEEIR